MSINVEQLAGELGDTPEEKPLGPPEAKPLSALVRHLDGDPNELLLHRYLCRDRKSVV